MVFDDTTNLRIFYFDEQLCLLFPLEVRSSLLPNLILLCQLIGK